MLLLYGTELNITTGNEGSTDGEWIDMPWTNVKDQPRKDGQTGQSNVDIYPTRYTSFFFSFSGAEAAVCSMKKKKQERSFFDEWNKWEQMLRKYRTADSHYKLLQSNVSFQNQLPS